MTTVRVQRTSTRLVRPLLMVILAAGLVMPSFAGVQGLEDEDNAKLSRHKAQTKQASTKKANNKNGAPENCGNIEVGNVSNSRPGRPVREVTVIVDGPIINANNNCR